MRRLAFVLLAFACVTFSLSTLTAQTEKPPQNAAKTAQKDYGNSSIVTKMMAFNKKKDGKLTKEELTDPRLMRLFERADTNKDGIVTREELTALAAKMDAEWGQGGGGGGGGKGGPKGKGPGGFGAPPRPGQVLPSFLQDQLKLSAEQTKQLNALQKEVDGQLEKILTTEQNQQFKEMRERGPGGKKKPPELER